MADDCHPQSPTRRLQFFRGEGGSGAAESRQQTYSSEEGGSETSNGPGVVEVKVAPLILQLRKAVDLLMKVHPLCAKVAHSNEVTALPCDDARADAAPLGKLTTAIPRSLERLRVVRRTLDEALEISEAVSEDALVEITLRQHELALHTREQADLRSEQERRLVEGVRWEVIELERSMLRSQRTHRRLDVDGAAARFDEFERQRSNVEGVHGYLTNEARNITESLRAQLQKNGQLNVNMREIEQARMIAMEENARANQLLASGENLEFYRKAKEREKVAADAEMAQARAEGEAELARLRDGWAMTQAKYTAEMLELQAEVRSVQARLKEKNKEAEQVLAKQASAWAECAEDMGKNVTYGIQALEDLRKEKAQHLHREVLRARQRERDAAASTQQRLEAQLAQVKLEYRSKAKMEELRLGEVVQADRMSVEAAKKKAEIWGVRANHMREAYKGHAIKSGAYVATMEPVHRRKIHNVWAS